jgi:hypothetical protein
MRTRMSIAMRQVWAPDSLPDRKTALKYFSARYFCEQDGPGGCWWVHLDRPLSTVPRSMDAIVAEALKVANG